MEPEAFASFWGTRPQFDPFTPDGAPAPVKWCAEARPLADWCRQLIEAIGAEPVPGKIAWGKVLLIDRYVRSYHKAGADHRAETNLDNHPCLHQVLVSAWNDLENLELRRAIPEMAPPRVPEPSHPEPAVDEEAEIVEELTGIVIGEDEDEEP